MLAFVLVAAFALVAALGFAAVAFFAGAFLAAAAFLTGAFFTAAAFGAAFFAGAFVFVALLAAGLGSALAAFFGPASLTGPEGPIEGGKVSLARGDGQVGDRVMLGKAFARCDETRHVVVAIARGESIKCDRWEERTLGTVKCAVI